MLDQNTLTLHSFSNEKPTKIELRENLMSLICYENTRLSEKNGLAPFCKRNQKSLAESCGLDLTRLYGHPRAWVILYV